MKAVFARAFCAHHWGQVAQLVEQRTENPRVGGSIPPLATIDLASACEQNRLVKAVPPLATIDFFQSNRPFRDRGFSVKVSAILRLLESDGWSLVAIRGSHRQFKHAVKPGRVTVAGKPSDDLAPGTLNSILKQAGLKL